MITGHILVKVIVGFIWGAYLQGTNSWSSLVGSILGLGNFYCLFASLYIYFHNLHHY